MDQSKDKKQTAIFRSVQVPKENKEKYFKVERNDPNKQIKNSTNNINPGQFGNNSNTSVSNNNFSFLDKDYPNQIFITHKESNLLNNNNNNNNSQMKKSIMNQNNNASIFVTTHKDINNNINQNLNNINNNQKLNKSDKRKYYKINQDTFDENSYKKKLNMVYFESIKKLCEHLNQNFVLLINNNEKITDLNEFLSDMYQNLQILNSKIEQINKLQNVFVINKEDLDILIELKNHLIDMNNTLNNKMSPNIFNVYINLDNFCTSCIHNSILK